MAEYKEPIKISVNDPICTATALQGTIIGILFDKKGNEIQTAIGKRISAIDDKIKTLEESIKDALVFIEGKDKEIEKLDQIYSERADERKAALEPLRRESREIYKKIQDAEHVFDKETEKKIAKEAVSFEKGFEQAENNLSAVDDLIDEEEKKCGRAIRGAVGPTGQIGSMGESGSNVYTINSSSNGTTWTTTNGNVGIGSDDSCNILNITQPEDKAMARLNTLKQKIREYSYKMDRIRNWIRDLQEEKRRLILIQGNIDPNRDYKLDLNKLSAFGFEDVEITK